MNAGFQYTEEVLTSKKFLGLSIFVLMLVLYAGNLPLQAQIDSNTVYKFKAVYIYNFLQFIEWPKQVFQKEKDELVIGVVGNPSFANILEQTIKGETIKGRSIVVRRISSEEEIETCNLLFISGGEVFHFQKVFKQNQGKPVLTIGESNGFVDAGGCINFFLEKNKLRFEINMEAVKKAQLTISSKLLRLAKIVGKEE